MKAYGDCPICEHPLAEHDGRQPCTVERIPDAELSEMQREFATRCNRVWCWHTNRCKRRDTSQPQPYPWGCAFETERVPA